MFVLAGPYLPWFETKNVQKFQGSRGSVDTVKQREYTLYSSHC